MATTSALCIRRSTMETTQAALGKPWRRIGGVTRDWAIQWCRSAPGAQTVDRAIELEKQDTTSPNAMLDVVKYQRRMGISRQRIKFLVLARGSSSLWSMHRHQALGACGERRGSTGDGAAHNLAPPWTIEAVNVSCRSCERPVQ